MARMYPERLPRILTDDPMRAAEARGYSRLGDSLDDAYTVMHGVPYLVEGEGSHRLDGEVDSLVGHSDLGLLVLEVKGGGIVRISPHRDQQDRHRDHLDRSS